MIITETTEAVNTTSLAVEDFSILDSPALYKLMYTSMYEDKEKIVLQELGANALDAHESAGITDTPIEITLPSEADPELIVKDFGIGMSLATLKAIYPVYGASTKRSDNKTVGGFGLGSKSPFSLTNSFIVESTHKGITSTVSCFLDNGKPKFSVFTSSDIGKSDGTEIRVPVTTSNSQQRLSQRVETLFTLWPVQPIVCGVVKKAKKPELLVADLLYLAPSENFSNSHRRENIVAVGPFTYKLPIGIIERLGESDELRETLRKFHSLASRESNIFYTVVPRFEIGDLELSPSRELIEATEDNYQKVLSKITCIKKETFKDAEKEQNAFWFLECLEALEKNGIFTTDTRGEKVFIGVDKKSVEAVFNQVLCPNPNLFNYMWAEASDIPYDKIQEEFKGLPDETIARAKTLLSNYRHDILRRYGTSLTMQINNDVKIVKLDLHSILMNSSSLVSSRYRALKDNTVLEVDQTITINNIERLRVTKNYRRYSDIRTIPVFVGGEGVRQKFYHWWRQMEDVVHCTGFIMFPNKEAYENEVAFLDKHEPIPAKDRFGITYSIKDVEKVWEDRPRRQKSTPSARKAAVKLDEETAVIGEYYELDACIRTNFTIKDLREMLKGDAEVVMVASNSRTTNLYNSLRNNLPDNVISKYPVLVINKKFQSRKTIKDLLTSSKVHYLGYGGVSDLSMNEVYNHIVKYELPKKILLTKNKNNGILNLLNFENASNSHMFTAFKGVLTSIEGVPSKFLMDSYCEGNSRRTRDDFASLLPEKLLSKLLLVGYHAGRGRYLENILSAADVKMLKHSINFHKGLKK